MRFVMHVCEAIGEALKDKDSYHLVAVTSTVMPGDTGGKVKQALESSSGKRVGQEIGLCYSPEFIALGSVIRDFLNPDFLLIGASDSDAAAALEKIYQGFYEATPPIAQMNFVNAELAKLAVNTFVTTKISFANMLARMCESLPGADVDEVTSALGLDSRIGPSYLTGAISYGGPCFPRDNLALRTMAEDVGAPADIAEATDHFNRRQIIWLADTVQARLHRSNRVGILGITYKTGSDVVEEAPGLLLAQELIHRDLEVVCFDPHGLDAARGVLGDSVSFAADPEACISATDVVVVATAWANVMDLPLHVWSDGDHPRTVIDCWRTLGNLKGQEGINYIPLGVSQT
jgi:UDPglucose 6-dehydrogenase